MIGLTWSTEVTDMRTNIIVRDKNTGRLFGTLHDAAKHYAVSHQTIWNYIHTKRSRLRGMNLAIEATTIRKISEEIKKLKKQIRDLENGMAQPVPSVCGADGDCIPDRDIIAAL
jgi:hypothetical protein